MSDALVDRTRPPFADPGFRGTANRTLAGSAPDWDLIGHVSPPEGAPNVLLVLISGEGLWRNTASDQGAGECAGPRPDR
jgi:hypothetical protein